MKGIFNTYLVNWLKSLAALSINSNFTCAILLLFDAIIFLI